MEVGDYIETLFGARGRRAVVTGASSGLGAEMARVLARAGADVLAVARRLDRLEALAAEAEERPGRIVPHAADLSDGAQVDAIADAAREQLGGCDVLVANAATYSIARLEQMSPEAFARDLEVNLHSQWRLSSALHPQLRDSDAGRVIHVASIYGLGAPVVNGLGAYAVAKHGIVGLTRSQAAEWGRDGITVNAIAPGYFPTEMTTDVMSDEKLKAKLLGRTVLGRFGRPEELGGVLLFLASPASGYVTGAVLPVDGGWTAW
jgi:NAD(P)-dependent dehydrogenase (short-subunit alcohol dehydrogenase family)